MSATTSPLPSPPPLPTLPVPGRFGGLAKYFKILRISLMERLVYRADFFVATLFRFLPLLSTFLLWEAVYADRPAGEKIAGFTHDNMIAYLLLVQVSRMFSSMPGLANGIAHDIRDGNLKKYLLQPIDMLWYLLSYRGAHKLAYIATVALPYGLLFFLCRDVFDGFPDAGTLTAYVAALLLAFVIGFFFEACIGVAGFWLLEVTLLMYILNIINFFVSGQLFPLDLLGPRRRGPGISAVSVSRVFPGDGVPGNEARAGACLGPADRAGLGGVLRRAEPLALPHRPAARLRLRGMRLARSRRGAEVGENLGGSVGVVDRVERGIADELVAQHRHGQSLQADAGNRPLLGEMVRQAREVVALDTADDRVIDLVHAGRLGGPHLRRTGDGRNIEDALARLGRQSFSEDVFEIGAGLGQMCQLLRDAARLVLHLARPDVDPIPFEAHGLVPPCM